MSLLHLTDQNFEQEINEGVVLVDFWAPWCGPCRYVGPIIEAIANEVKDCKIAKMNVDENQIVPSKYSIMSIPTIIIFKDGKILETLIGARNKEEYLSAIERAKAG